MGLFTRDIETLEQLFLHQLADVYYAEHQIVKALSTMIESAATPQLQQMLEDHRSETEHQIERLDEVFRLQGGKPDDVECPAIDGIITEAESVADAATSDVLRDAALIASAQAVEHYEMSRYGTLICWAERLGKTDWARLLQVSLDEETVADQKLTALAEEPVDRRAAE